VTVEHDLVLYVGMPQASSVLGPAFRQLQSQLRARGVAYLDGAQLLGLPHAPGWNHDRITHPDQAGAFEGELAAFARDERHRAGSLWRRRDVPLLIVSDQLLGQGDIGRRDTERLRPYATRGLRQVINALQAQNVQIVLHTQRQDRLLELAYLRWLSDGHAATISAYFPNLFQPVLDYGKLLDRLKVVPGVSSVIVRPVELADAGVHAFVNDALDPVGLRDLLDMHVVRTDLFSRPTVYSEQGAALARAVNPLVRGAEFEVVRKYLHDTYSAQLEYGLPEILEPDARDRMLSAYAEPNRRLFSTYMPDLPVSSYDNDVETFALGNALEQPALYEPKLGDRAATAVSLGSSRASGALRQSAAQLARRLPESQRQRLQRLRHGS
jgi:hypothetical protein